MNDQATPPRVVIADDQALVRGGFRMILGAAGIPVVGEAADGRQALAAVLEHRPDVAQRKHATLRLPDSTATGAWPASPASVSRVAKQQPDALQKQQRGV